MFHFMIFSQKSNISLIFQSNIFSCPLQEKKGRTTAYNNEKQKKQKNGGKKDETEIKRNRLQTGT